MAHLWIQKICEGGRRWAALPLAGSAYRLIEAEPFVRRASPRPAAANVVHLMRVVLDSVERWFLLVPPAARLAVNGRRPVIGVYVLADRDELRLRNGEHIFFSTERLPVVVPFPGAAREMSCARCRQPITRGAPAVRCPGCAAWCHASQAMPCWSYAGTTHCPLCDQSNDPEADFRWVPEGI